MLKSVFQKIGFSALNFTDSRSKFVFYNLEYLWKHINILYENKVTLAHMASVPVSAAEIYYALYGEKFVNEVANTPFDYTFFKTQHSNLLFGKDGYIFSKDKIINEIILFVNNCSQKYKKPC